VEREVSDAGKNIQRNSEKDERGRQYTEIHIALFFTKNVEVGERGRYTGEPEIGKCRDGKVSEIEWKVVP
jgi:hypothetical protein